MRNIDHLNTQNALKDIMSQVKALGSSFQAYKNSISDNDRATYSEGYIKAKSEERLNQLKASAADKSETFLKAVNKAKETELLNGAVFGVADGRLNNALDLIERTGGKDYELTDRIINSFRGEEANLKALKNYLNEKDYGALESSKALFYNSETLFEDLEDALLSLSANPSSNVIYNSIVTEVDKISNTLGLEGVSTDTGLDQAELYTSAMRAAMGLPG